MSQRPAILGERRAIALITLVTLALGQAAAMVAAAFATRDVFMSLRDGGEFDHFVPLVTIALSGVSLCVLRSIEGRIAEAAGQSYVAAIRRVFFRHVTLMPASAIARRRSGALSLRFVGDLTAFKGWIARGLARLISALVLVPAALLILYLLEPILFWVALGPLVTVVLGIWLLGGAPLGTAHAELRSKRARLAAAMAERLPQGVALRRSGRLKTEMKALTRNSAAIAEASIHREWLAATIRALPDAGAGVAAALCLWACMQQNLGVPDAIAALTALSMVVWPLRHLADVADRRRAFLVASEKLDRMLSAPRIGNRRKTAAKRDAPAVNVIGAMMPDGAVVNIELARGEQRRLSGPPGSGKSHLLKALAGMELPPEAERFEVCGTSPGELPAGRVLYLGQQSVSLSGSLRREVTLGIGRKAEEDEIIDVLERASLSDLLEKLGGLNGKVAEGRRNLTATEQVRLYLARGLLARPDLAVIDADEIGLRYKDLESLLNHLRSVGTAVLLVTTDPEAKARLGSEIEFSADALSQVREACWGAAA